MALAIAWPLTSTAAPIGVVNPNKADWEVKPSGDAVSAAFPPLAAALGLEASTTMQCVVDRLGMLHECQVIELVGPKGLGFEAASLSLAPMFRLRPDRTPSGRARNGAARFPLAFRLSPMKTELPIVSSPPPDLLPLARERVASFVGDTRLEEAFQLSNKDLMEQDLSGVEPATRDEVMADIRAAQAKVRGEIFELQANLLAANLTREQIQAGFDFDKTSGAKVLSKASADIRRRTEAASSGKRIGLLVAAHQEFCATHDCRGMSAADKPPSSPPWIQEPTQAQISAAQPKLAILMLVGGSVDLDCGATEFGVLANCEIVREKPAGFGFGAAALAVSSYYQRPPALRGERTQLRVSFPFPDVSVLQPPKTERKQGPKYDLARGLAEAEGGRVALERQSAQMIETIDRFELPGVSDAFRKDAVAVFQGRLRAAADEALSESAEYYADLLTEAELKERLAYVNGPDYAAVMAMEKRLTQTYAQMGEVVSARVMQEAGRLYCANHDCPRLPPYRGPQTAADPIPPLRP